MVDAGEAGIVGAVGSMGVGMAWAGMSCYPERVDS